MFRGLGFRGLGVRVSGLGFRCLGFKGKPETCFFPEDPGTHGVYTLGLKYRHGDFFMGQRLHYIMSTWTLGALKPVESCRFAFAALSDSMTRDLEGSENTGKSKGFPPHNWLA